MEQPQASRNTEEPDVVAEDLEMGPEQDVSGVPQILHDPRLVDHGEELLLGSGMAEGLHPQGRGLG